MDKRKLIARVRSKTGWDSLVAGRASEAVIDSIRDLIRQGNRLTVHGFGSFWVQLEKPRRARNLQTGQPILVPARRKVKFRPSPELLP